MTLQANKQVVATFVERLGAKDAAGAFKVVAKEALFWVPRGVSIPGAGKDGASWDTMVQVFTQEFASMEGAFKLEIVGNMIAESDRVVCEMRGSSRFRDGYEYKNTYCFVLVVRDGLIRSIRDYLDTVIANELGPHMAHPN
jgi:ketosteroid isomerase-like protein